jgi:hypothetical protein
MAASPCKVTRFLVWASSDSKFREDALIAFDEGFGHAYSKFGPVHAHFWSFSQAARSLPYGLMITIVKFGATVAALVS